MTMVNDEDSDAAAGLQCSRLRIAGQVLSCRMKPSTLYLRPYLSLHPIRPPVVPNLIFHSTCQHNAAQHQLAATLKAPMAVDSLWSEEDDVQAQALVYTGLMSALPGQIPRSTSHSWRSAHGEVNTTSLSYELTGRIRG